MRKNVRFSGGVLVVLLAILPATNLWAQPKPLEVVAQGTIATALLDVDAHEFGSAFCVDEGGFFLTNAHVVKNAGKGGQIKLVLLSGQRGQTVLKAQVVRTDAELDLALLQIEDPKALVALSFGQAINLVETQELTAFGYPFGTLLGFGNHYPAVSVSMGKVTSLRRAGGELDRVQLDASLNPGNSGGPVLGSDGKVVGVVVSGHPGTGISFAIPAERAIRFLAKPQIIFSVPTVSFANRFEPAKFSVRLATFGKTGLPGVGLILQSDGGSERRLAMQREGDAYTALVAPAVPPAAPRSHRIVATFADGSITGSVTDVELKASGRTLSLLNDIRHIDRSTTPAIELVDGTVIHSPPEGLGLVEMDLGSLTMKVDLNKAARIDMVQPTAEPTSVKYRIVVTDGGETVAESAGTLELRSVAALDPLDKRGTTLPDLIGVSGKTAERTEVPLPSSVADAIEGGGGRYLILTLKPANQLAVFDAAVGKIVQYIPIPLGTVYVAAGADKLVIVVPSNRTIQIWSLSTFQRELTAAMPVEGEVQAIAMGSAAKGPLMVRWAAGSDELSRCYLTLLDIPSLKKIGDPAITDTYSVHRDRVHIRAAASGDVFGLWNTGSSPSGLEVLAFTEGTRSNYYVHDTVGYVIPSPDGSKIFTGSRGAFTLDQLRHQPPDGQRSGVPMSALPATVNGYYLTFPVLRAPPNGKTMAIRPSLYVPGSDRPLATLLELPELGGDVVQPWLVDDFSFDKRLHLLTRYDLLLTIPMTNDMIVMHRFSVAEALDKSGIDYLFVDSDSPPVAQTGRPYRYQINVRSKRGGVQTRLDSGPEGMTVSPSGLIDWAVPSDAVEAIIILTVTDASGQQILYTIAIPVK